MHTKTSRDVDLEDQARISFSFLSRTMSEFQEIRNIQIILSRFLIFLLISQDSFYTELLVRIFSLSSQIESCLSIMTIKNLVWLSRKTRIWKDERQDCRLVEYFEIFTYDSYRVIVTCEKELLLFLLLLFLCWKKSVLRFFNFNIVKR